MALSWSNTFGLNRNLLAAALRILQENPGIDNQKLAQELGVGGRKGVGYSGWLLYTGLRNIRPREVTEIGRIILRFDPYIEDPVTQGMLHYSLCTNSNASVWNHLSTYFIPRRDSFFRTEVTDSCLAFGLGKAGSKNKHLISDIGIFLKAYTDTEGFSELDYLQEQSNGNYRRGNIANIVSPLLVAYVIYSQHQQVPQTSTISIGRLLSEDGNVGKIFLMNRQHLMDKLKYLEFLGLVRISQEADLDNITYTHSGSCLDILLTYYEKSKQIT